MDKVLIVDDVAMNRKMIKTILNKAINNIEIVEAEDGFEAIDLVKSGGICVIILDIMMPGKDGIEVLQELKDNHEFKSIPIIICSAIHEISSVEKALALGALDYFTKPLTDEQIRITLPLKVKNALEYYEQKNQLEVFYDHVKEEMKLAEQLQKSMISEHSVFTGAKMWGKYIPCQEIGGDIFCTKEVDGKLWFMIADVSGHGIAAAMISTMLSVVFNISITYCSFPQDVLQRLNKTMCEVFGSSHYGLVSSFVGCIHDNQLEFSNAGHPYPVFYQKEEDLVEKLEINGLLLGVLEDANFEHVSRKMNSGDAIVLFTDGLFDKGQKKGCVSWGLIHDYCRIHKQGFNHIPTLIQEMSEYFGKTDDLSFIDDVAIMMLKKT